MKRQQIEENRQILRPIVGAIVLCGRQNISLQGHRDDSSIYLSDDVDCGNFICMEQYAQGRTLEEFFKSTSKNLTYKSKTIQNEIIDICGNLNTKKITDEICKARGLSGDAIATTIKDFLHDQNLPVDNCRNQGYDGAGNMAGRLSGAAARIQEINKKALYVHCNL
ncbi:Hypothetical predicted protein [Paramuricea clavata]|uniref:Uncharacterized protein n=1 Tax=Paramuricea clavata TaxID=317549 RepID=A0A6S7FPU5_PARCT|nr:Hypothetical predicted protein [Paramuricea clavata]